MFLFLKEHIGTKVKLFSHYYGNHSNGLMYFYKIDAGLSMEKLGTIKRKTLTVQTAEKEIIIEDYKKKITGCATRGKGKYN